LIVAILAALVATALIAPRLLEDPGYVMIDLGAWRVEMSLVTLVGGVLLGWIAISLTLALLRLPGRAWRRGRQMRADRQLENGLLALTEGDWQRAEKELGKSLSYRGSTVGYLAAARAAQGQSDVSRRDRWLNLADSRFGRRHFITGLARARLLTGEGRSEEAVPVLEDLHLQKPRHSGVLRLLLQAYQELDRWGDVRLLTPALRRAGIVDRERAEELTRLAAGRELQASPDIEALQQAWRGLNRKQRHQRDLVVTYARRASELGRPGLGGPELKRLLDHELDREALDLYSEAGDAERAKRIADCEAWLRKAPDHPGLQRALGLMYLGDRQYENARTSLERAVQAQPDGEAYAALGRIQDRSGQTEAAMQCYRNALRLKQGRSATPLPPPAEQAPDEEIS
jgi:HemY protein